MFHTSTRITNKTRESTQIVSRNLTECWKLQRKEQAKHAKAVETKYMIHALPFSFVRAVKSVQRRMLQHFIYIPYTITLS